MPKREEVKISVVSQSIYGSITNANSYGADSVASVIDWLQKLVERIPPEFRESAEVEIESIGGYEGEHHAEIEVSYHRPETDAEQAERLAREVRDSEYRKQRERTEYDRLKAKFG